MKSDSSNEPTEVDNNDLNSEASVSSEEASGQYFSVQTEQNPQRLMKILIWME